MIGVVLEQRPRAIQRLGDDDPDKPHAGPDVLDPLVVDPEFIHRPGGITRDGRWTLTDGVIEPAAGQALPEVADTVLGWRLVNPRMEELYPPITLGMTAEAVAEKYDVTREDQDAFALRSHRLALDAIAAGRFTDEIEPLEVPIDHRRRDTTMVETDEGPRPDTTLEVLSRLPAAFKEGGTVTAGNSSPMNDGAAALLITTEEGLNRHQLEPLARVVSSGAAGVHPDLMGMGPVPASEKALARAGLAPDQLDLVEVNEAFASQAVASVRQLGIDPDIVNVN